jgi:hypothetical protein
MGLHGLLQWLLLLLKMLKCVLNTKTVVAWICNVISNMVNNCMHSHEIWGRIYSAWCAQAENIPVFFFEVSVTSPIYLNKLWTAILLPILQLYGNEPFCFQWDDTPSHYHRDVRSCLTEILVDQWRGQRGSAEYPPHSPNLTPFNFYSCRSLKDVVFHRKLPTPETLQEEIGKSCAVIRVDILTMALRAVVHPTQKCLQANDGHFAHLFQSNMSQPSLSVPNLDYQ